MDEFFTTQSIIKTFKVSHQTVKNWCDEFGRYLSPTATPGDGKKRVFTPNDLKVFALLSDYHKRGFRWEDAHAALQNGQRGEIPQDVELEPVAPPALLVSLRDEINNLQLLLKSAESERDEERGQKKLLREMLDQKEKQLREVIEENALLKAQLRGSAK
jgi:DNA-binding transcriptional MerR regulator